MSTKLAEKSTLSLPENIQIRPRFVTATSLFDGHDASINIIRRLLQEEGAEVIHLGHNRSVDEVITAALQEDAHAIAVSSYQGGHNEYFRYMIDRLREEKADHIRVFGGGGGVIIPEEIQALEEYGVSKIFSPEDGIKMGLDGIARYAVSLCKFPQPYPARSKTQDLPRAISYLEYFYEANRLPEENLFPEVEKSAAGVTVGFSGLGGSGKSSLLDEFIRLLKQDFPDLKIALFAVDPTRRKTGGALLGDRLRMNSISDGHVYMRSLATRADHVSVAGVLPQLADISKNYFDLIFLESAGVGQADTALADIADFNIFVMTAEYGADTQLEKISMLDYADFVLLNKFDREKSEDALRAIKKQFRRNHKLFHAADSEIPVYGTIASHFNDEGVFRAYRAFIGELKERFPALPVKLPEHEPPHPPRYTFIPSSRKRYLSEIADSIRNYHKETKVLAEKASIAQSIQRTIDQVEKASSGEVQEILQRELKQIEKELPDDLLQFLKNYRDLKRQYEQEKFTFRARDKEITVDAATTSLSGLSIPKVVLPDSNSWEDLTYFYREENAPGKFPFTAGVFPFKRADEDPTRMFAGEGNPERTNRRFHFISEGQKAIRLSTAFDSITLYGEDPDERPDIYGKIGNAGVSICTLDDMKKLYSGFDLSSPTTSVSMTINGPAATILAFYFNTAVDQAVEKELKQQGQWEEVETKIQAYFANSNLVRPKYEGSLPKTNNGLGLGFLGVDPRKFVDGEFYEKIRKDTIRKIRGTVQADILKEDQAQNTCIFSTEFSLKLMGDIQEYFCQNDVRNFYSVSVSGYHIAEAGANPITQVAFTLANGFTYVESYLHRGLNVDEFARNLSFFFSNGMDPEYAVIGRVARRIWAIAMKYLYNAGERSQKLKYHIQTSGRSLHAQEISFNDIRTTLQALYAIMDNCNSLHTNAYDEAITTPTPESVRRAIAIQLIINRELGLTKNENPLQGSYFIRWLTNAVEEAILQEFDRISDRGGVMGAMESMYQRHKIQEESLYYESLKESGKLPIIGVNTFLSDNPESSVSELMRSTEEEKKLQIKNLRAFQKAHAQEAKVALENLKQKAVSGTNLFEELLETVRVASLGQITNTLYEAGGKYRRNM
ncbi:MAG: methylmalonyl-CoA mutase [Candidatus Hydrogenedentota bacterium]|nr:MAG: methylmalonyl-CoA mutase [Candidatus Hydrogenedentota bacterium]